MVGVTRVERATSRSQSERSTRLSYTPMINYLIVMDQAVISFKPQVKTISEPKFLKRLEMVEQVGIEPTVRKAGRLQLPEQPLFIYSITDKNCFDVFIFL